MGQLFGEDMGVIAAALETLEMEDADDEEELSFDLELEENLYTTLEETMDRLEAMPEPEPIPYQKEDVKWERFGILLSGILSSLNDHELYGCGGTYSCDGTENRVPCTSFLGDRWSQRSAGYDPLSGAGGLYPAVSAL